MANTIVRYYLAYAGVHMTETVPPLHNVIVNVCALVLMRNSLCLHLDGRINQSNDTYYYTVLRLYELVNLQFYWLGSLKQVL